LELYNVELQNLYSLSNIIRMIRPRRMICTGHVFRNGKKGNAYRMLVTKPEGKRPLGRALLRWVDSTEIYLGQSGWGGKDWIDLAQNRNQWRALVNTVMNLQVV
jgi:hypothetical protein